MVFERITARVWKMSRYGLWNKNLADYSMMRIGCESMIMGWWGLVPI